MSLIQEVYASAPIDELIIPTLEISWPGQTPIRVCTGYEDFLLGTDQGWQRFEAGSISIALPGKTTVGTQTLKFTIYNVNGIVMRHAMAALESDAEVTIIYREYLYSDRSEPAIKPYVMKLRGGTFEGMQVSLEAGYQSSMNTAWPRQKFTAENAPGIRFA